MSNPVSRAVEREFDEGGYTTIEGCEGIGHVLSEVREDYRTLQRLLKEAAGVIRETKRGDDVASVNLLTSADKIGRWCNRRDSLLAELPEGYGNE